MRHLAKAGVILVASTVLAVVVPGIRDRGILVLRKVSGASSEAWSDLAIRLVPYRWQEGARRRLGRRTEEWSRSLTFPLQLGANTRLSYRISLGATPNLTLLDCHYTVLAAGQTPHPLHVHDDEEIIVPFVGDVDILRATTADSTETQQERIGYGRLVYHSSRLPHTIRAVGPGPSGYLVLRWSSAANGITPNGTLPGQSSDFGKVLAAEPLESQSRAKTLLFEGPTRLLRRLQAHTSLARFGEGSAPHQDPHDVAVIVLQGAIETTSGRVEAPGIIFHPAGRTHFVRSVGAQPARYLAIEFLRRD